MLGFFGSGGNAVVYLLITTRSVLFFCFPHLQRPLSVVLSHCGHFILIELLLCMILLKKRGSRATSSVFPLLLKNTFRRPNYPLVYSAKQLANLATSSQAFVCFDFDSSFENSSHVGSVFPLNATNPTDLQY